MHLRRLALFALAGSLFACAGDGELATYEWRGAPVTGGTLALSQDGRMAAIADADRDHIVLLDFEDTSVAADIALEPGDQPGRIAWDGSGRFHVALRGGGALVTVANHVLAARRQVCPEPRGVAWDEGADVIHVACAGGELVTLPAAGGDPVRVLRLEHDLRDVVVAGGQLWVTRFRTAEVLRLDADGNVVERNAPTRPSRFSFDPFDGSERTVTAVPSVAWRAVGMPDGGVLVAHQRRVDAPLMITEGGYGGGCGGVVESTSSTFRPGQPAASGRSLIFAPLPVDVAVNADATAVAFAIAGTPSVQIFGPAVLSGSDVGPCEEPPPPPEGGGGGDERPGGVSETWLPIGKGIPTSVAFRPNGDLVIYYPEEPSLVVDRRLSRATTVKIPLPGGLAEDRGRTIFHQSTFAGLACASCHPEGSDDGQVWQFRNFDFAGDPANAPPPMSRRTQNISGGILGRAPYHWTGDMSSLQVLIDEVLVRRMGGAPVFPEEVGLLGEFIDRIPALAPSEPTDLDAVARGEALFTSEEVECSKCHAGELYTTNELVDVGTGGVFKVPSLLGVGGRAPFLHDGCASTLADRFGDRRIPTCGGGDLHGKTSHLTSAQIADLVAYLESL